MTITTRRMLSVLGLVGTCVCLCARGSQGQASDKPQATPSAPPKASVIKLDLPQLVSPYYEWITKDTAVAWVQKPTGPVVALLLTGGRTVEKPISGASDLKELGDGRPYGFKMSPDGTKILSIMGGAGGPAGGWRVGTLDGTSYTHGGLIELQGLDLFWTPNSKEWISLAGNDQNSRFVHYYVDGVTSPLTVPLRGFAPKRDNANRYIPVILGIRPDGKAILTVADGFRPTNEIDFYLMDLDSGRVLAENRRVTLPTGKYIWGTGLCTPGDRIAWLFMSDKSTDEYLDVWLSNADGSDLKRFSDFPTHKMGKSAPEQPSYKSYMIVDCPIRWTVDDKAISSLQGDTLQIVLVK